MTTKCKNCKKRIKNTSAFCTYCGAKNRIQFGEQTSINQISKLFSHPLIIVLCVIIALITVIVILNVNLLLPWQLDARKNRQVILEYAEQHYPNAVIVDQEFNSAHFFVWNNFKDCIVFKWEDVEFGITAESGDILIDGYYGARAIRQFDIIIQDNFLKPRGINAYTSYQFVDDYYELYPYNGGLMVTLTIFDQGSSPQEVGWLYDFYKYWKKEGEFLRLYSVDIDIIVDKQRMCHINYLNDDDFSDEKKFYAAFNEG